MSTDAENRFLDREGWGAYSAWHLGVDRQESEEGKGRFSFPMGDYEKVHRCAIISMESRAAQYDHDEIARTAKRQLSRIDGE